MRKVFTGSEDHKMSKLLLFVFAKSSELRDMVEATQRKIKGYDPTIGFLLAAVDIAKSRNYYVVAKMGVLLLNIAENPYW